MLIPEAHQILTGCIHSAVGKSLTGKWPEALQSPSHALSLCSHPQSQVQSSCSSAHARPHAACPESMRPHHGRRKTRWAPDKVGHERRLRPKHTFRRYIPDGTTEEAAAILAAVIKARVSSRLLKVSDLLYWPRDEGTFRSYLLHFRFCFHSIKKINVLATNTVSCLAFAMHSRGNFLVTSCIVIKYHKFVPFHWVRLRLEFLIHRLWTWLRVT